MLLTFGPLFLPFLELLASCRQHTQNRTALMWIFLALSGAHRVGIFVYIICICNSVTKYSSSSIYFHTFYVRAYSEPFSSDRQSLNYFILFILSSYHREDYPPVIVLCAVDPVVCVEGDLLALHVPLAHDALQAPVMKHQVIPDTQSIVRTHIFSACGAAARTSQAL